MRSRVCPRDDRGSALVASLILVMVLVIGAAAFLSHTSTEVIQVKKNVASIRAFYHAEAGLNYAQAQLLRGWQLTSLSDPFHFLDQNTITSLPAQMLVGAGTPEEGQFDVQITNVSSPHTNARDVTVKSVGKFQEETRTVMATFCLEVNPPRVFDYAYFLNHCGWMEGMPSSFQMYGNVRSVGDFSFFNSSLHLNGNPEYKTVRGQTNYKDSGGVYSGASIVDALSLNGMGALPLNQYMNEDLNDNHSLDPGEDHNQNSRLTRPQPIPMPNLAEMDAYEEGAMAWRDGAGGSIKIEGAGEGGGDLLVSDAVYGDEADEQENLILWGTQENPIVVDGPVVVRGALIIKGYVKGQGSLFVRQNVYIPDNLIYVNPPVGRPNWNYYDHATPEERYSSWIEAVSQWRQENADKDGLGLFAGENVVIGDFLDDSWRSDVEAWLDHPANESAEPANGLDQVPNTNDVGENDGAWTVDRYSQEDIEKGLVPPGKTVGEVVPGLGEDVDSDALEDGRILLSDFDLPSPVESGYWGGWTPLGEGGSGDGNSGSSLRDLLRNLDRGEWRDLLRRLQDLRRQGGGQGGGMSLVDLLSELFSEEGGGPTTYLDFYNENGGDALDHIDAMICTSHATVANWGRNSEEVHLLGGIISRVAAIIFRNDGSCEWIHDERFTGGGENTRFLLTRAKKPIQVIHWSEVPKGYALSQN
jgi:hypothetical protein